MRYPDFCKNVIDITKAPYFADNTGKTDCTAAIRQAIDDCLQGYITGLEETRKELRAIYEKQGGNVYIGAEIGRVIDGEVYITYPKEQPASKIVFFPKGTYLVSDTVCYTFDNLSTRQHATYICELCRNIHLLGEDQENTVIRLADNAKGFEKGKHKPVVCLNKAAAEDKESTNCAHLNTIEDITIDCGNGNEGAVGILFAASNLGRIENVNVKAQTGLYGIEFDYGSEACVENVKISGFEYGIKTSHTSPLVFSHIDLSENKVAGVLTKNGNLNFENVNWGEIPAFSFVAGHNGRYFVEEEAAKHIGDLTGNFIFHAPKNPLVARETWPQKYKYENFESCVCVDDFGAVGDGKTDSTLAIQKAMNSGKEVVLFGEGKYVINQTVKIPATVKIVDLMYCNIKPGYSFIIGEMEGVFEICEDGAEPLFVEHFISDEHFCGFFRFCKQTAKRTVVLKDLFLASALYVNTVGGSKVYFDNCFTHTNHYTQDCFHRDGYVPVFCRMIPVELHNQKAYGRNLNIERADTELLNDNSDLLIDGYKTEGPGKMVTTVNGGKTQLNLFNSAWWGNQLAENEMFEVCDASLSLVGGNIFCYSDKEELRMALRVSNGNEMYRAGLFESSVELSGKDALGRSWGRLIENTSIE